MQSAALFSWVRKPWHISIDQVARCAKREPGRGWEVLETELNNLGEPSCIYFNISHALLLLHWPQTGMSLQDLHCCLPVSVLPTVSLLHSKLKAMLSSLK